MKYIHEYTKEIVCPYCGYEFSDSYEILSKEEDLGVIECEHCEKEFLASRFINIEYSTKKIKDIK
jgi:transcription elongation factor Elf1